MPLACDEAAPVATRTVHRVPYGHRNVRRITTTNLPLVIEATVVFGALRFESIVTMKVTPARREEVARKRSASDQESVPNPG
jgi:hypothetical protein